MLNKLKKIFAKIHINIALNAFFAVYVHWILTFKSKLNKKTLEFDLK